MATEPACLQCEHCKVERFYFGNRAKRYCMHRYWWGVRALKMRWISSKERGKTSPSWCPKRRKENDYATEQLTLYDVPPEPPKQDDKQKKSWEDGFQRWSNKQFHEGPESYGACGYGSMCDYCEDNSYGRPCVRALNEMCRKERIHIDYSKRNYEDIWNGVFEDGK